MNGNEGANGPIKLSDFAKMIPTSSVDTNILSLNIQCYVYRCFRSRQITYHTVMYPERGKRVHPLPVVINLKLDYAYLFNLQSYLN